MRLGQVEAEAHSSQNPDLERTLEVIYNGVSPNAVPKMQYPQPLGTFKKCPSQTF